jgi:Lon protease-like protein
MSLHLFEPRYTHMLEAVCEPALAAGLQGCRLGRGAAGAAASLAPCCCGCNSPLGAQPPALSVTASREAANHAVVAAVTAARLRGAAAGGGGRCRIGVISGRVPAPGSTVGCLVDVTDVSVTAAGTYFCSAVGASRFRCVCVLQAGRD